MVVEAHEQGVDTISVVQHGHESGGCETAYGGEIKSCGFGGSGFAKHGAAFFGRRQHGRAFLRGNDGHRMCGECERDRFEPAQPGLLSEFGY